MSRSFYDNADDIVNDWFKLLFAAASETEDYPISN